MKTKDRFLFDLNDQYALMRDDLQFIIAKKEKDRLRPLKFTTQGRKGILRCLRQLSSKPSKDALALISDQANTIL